MSRIEAAAREIWKADNTTLGIDPPESMEAWVEETEGYLELARAALRAADAHLPSVEAIYEVIEEHDLKYDENTSPVDYRKALSRAIYALFGEVDGDE